MKEKEIMIEKVKDADFHIREDKRRKFKVDSYLVDRIVKNIQRRSENHREGQKPAKEEKRKFGENNLVQITETNFADTIEDIEFQRCTTESEYHLEPVVMDADPNEMKLEKGDYLGFHHMMAKTKTERMLETYDEYSKGWK